MSKKTAPTKVFDDYLKLHTKASEMASKHRAAKAEADQAAEAVNQALVKMGLTSVTRPGGTIKLHAELGVKGAQGVDAKDIVAALRTRKLSHLISANWPALKSWVKAKCGVGDDYDGDQLPESIASVLAITPKTKLTVSLTK